MKVNLKFQAQNLLEVPKFKTALEYRDRFTFGHEKLHTILDLHLSAVFQKMNFELPVDYFPFF